MKLMDQINNLDMTALLVVDVVDDVAILIKQGYTQVGVSYVYNYLRNKNVVIEWSQVNEFFHKFTFPVPKSKKDFAALLTTYITEKIQLQTI